MKAKFITTANVIEAAADRAGIMYQRYIGTDLYEEEPDHVMSISYNPINCITSIVGTSNEIMRVIGALADDGQDCLLSAGI